MQGNEVNVFLVAWVGHSQRFPAKKQWIAIEPYQPERVYRASDGENVWDAITSLREGECLVVDGLGRLASRRDDLQRCLLAVHERGAVVFDARTGKAADGVMFNSMATAFREIAGEASMPSRAIAKRRGKKGGRPSVFTEGMRRKWDKVRRDAPNDREAANILGVSVSTLYRKLGKSPREPGWPQN